VIGVASLVAAISFVLFPLALVAGLVGLVIGIVALARRQQSGATNIRPGHRRSSLQHPRLAVAINLSVQLGTWAARNTGVFTRFDNCLIKSGTRADVSQCIAHLANDIRPQPE
jgi:hypothetical protein